MKENLLFTGITIILLAALATWVFWPLNLSEEEITQLAAFLRTLSGGVNTDPKWLQAP